MPQWQGSNTHGPLQVDSYSAADTNLLDMATLEDSTVLERLGLRARPELNARRGTYPLWVMVGKDIRSHIAITIKLC